MAPSQSSPHEDPASREEASREEGVTHRGRGAASGPSHVHLVPHSCRDSLPPSCTGTFHEATGLHGPQG